jgi:hypothetical protein
MTAWNRAPRKQLGKLSYSGLGACLLHHPPELLDEITALVKAQLQWLELSLARGVEPGHAWIPDS